MKMIEPSFLPYMGGMVLIVCTVHAKGGKRNNLLAMTKFAPPLHHLPPSFLKHVLQMTKKPFILHLLNLAHVMGGGREEETRATRHGKQDLKGCVFVCS